MRENFFLFFIFLFFFLLMRENAYFLNLHKNFSESSFQLVHSYCWKTFQFSTAMYRQLSIQNSFKLGKKGYTEDIIYIGNCPAITFHYHFQVKMVVIVQVKRRVAIIWNHRDFWVKTPLFWFHGSVKTREMLVKRPLFLWNSEQWYIPNLSNYDTTRVW